MKKVPLTCFLSVIFLLSFATSSQASPIFMEKWREKLLVSFQVKGNVKDVRVIARERNRTVTASPDSGYWVFRVPYVGKPCLEWEVKVISQSAKRERVLRECL